MILTIVKKSPEIRASFSRRHGAMLLALVAGLAHQRSGMTAQEIDYGADKVNSMAATPQTKIGGAEAFDYLALKNHIGPSGVPLGGIGVGYFQYNPEGAFSRFCINNWHGTDQAPPPSGIRGSFLALWRPQGAQLLQRGSAFAGMNPATNTIYRGLFPVAQCRIDDVASVRAWSSLIPHNVKDSSLPLAWIEVELSNSQSTPQPVAVAFSWQDLIGRQIRDIRNIELLRAGGPSVWGKEKAIHAADAKKEKTWEWLPRVATQCGPLDTGPFVGLRQFSPPLEPVLKTYQNYNNEIALVTDASSGAEVTFLPAYAIDNPQAAWDSFRREGRFGAKLQATTLFDPANNQEMASALAVRVTLEAGEKRVIRFALAWHQPELKAGGDAATYFGDADYGRYYHRDFPTLQGLLNYGAENRDRMYQESQAWQNPILTSSYPDWLKFKLINSAYTIFTNTILNKAGDFTVMEGGMGGLSGTMDQRISAHPFYFKFFPELDRSDLELFGLNPGKDGQILHFDGHYYFGLNSRQGHSPVPDNSMVDNSGGWLLQLAKDYQQKGDLAWIKSFDGQIHRTLDYLRRRVVSRQFKIITGSTTYDDFWHPPIYAYNATTYPAVLQAGAVLLDALGDSAGAQQCRSESAVSAKDALRALWNGRFFAYGADLDGRNRRDDIMFSGQLAGPFLSRYCGWGDLFPQEAINASILAQLKTNIGPSPDYYAPKVWSIPDQQAMRDPRRPTDRHNDSTCWPFYLESYSAMAAIQGGYVEDGLDIMRHIQLVHLRNGWTWSQNLWRPGELTYVCAPVTWFITDVLAGSALDLPGQTLHLAPVMTGRQQRVELPLYFPGFWATVSADRSTRQLSLHVTRVFDHSSITFQRIVSSPAGRPTTEARTVSIAPFTVSQGATLDLSSAWDQLVAANVHDPVLPRYQEVPFASWQPTTE